jgi:hypothetical protein
MELDYDIEDYEEDEILEIGMDEIEIPGTAPKDEYEDNIDYGQTTFDDLAREDDFTPDEERFLIDIHREINDLEELGWDGDELRSNPEVIEHFYDAVARTDVEELVDSRYSTADVTDDIFEQYKHYRGKKSLVEIIEDNDIFLNSMCLGDRSRTTRSESYRKRTADPFLDGLENW